MQIQAGIEGIPFEQYLLYALTRQAAFSYTVQAIPKQEVAQQWTQFTALLESLPKASPEDISMLLAQREAEREAAEPNQELSSEVATQLRQKIKAAREAAGVPI
jgi:hypothetical protein